MTDKVQAEIPELLQDLTTAEPDDVASPVTVDEDQKPVFNKYQVRDVVKREQQKAYEKGKREALMELQQQQPQAATVNPQPAGQAAPVTPATQSPQSIGGMQQLSSEQISQQIRQAIAQEMPRSLQEHAQQISQQNLVTSFVSKMKAAESEFPGLEQKLNEVDYTNPAMLALISHADKTENTGAVMAELLDNPSKMGNIISLIYSQPKLAEKAMQNLSSSIRQNKDAASQEHAAKEPFGQLKPSTNASKDDGDMSTADFQALFRKQKKALVK